MQAAQAPACQGPDRLLRAPKKLVMPRGSVDCHAHILGPEARFPYAQSRVYTPPDCTEAHYLAQLNALGVDRAVLVQPSVYGTDNRAMLETLARAPIPLRAVAVVDHQVTQAELLRMHGLGVRGVRCNVVDVVDKKAGLPMDQLRRLADRIAVLGWHLELLAHVHDYPTLDHDLRDLPVPIVFGHFGYVPIRYGAAAEGFAALLQLMRQGRAWVKMTGPYRISGQSQPPYGDIAPFVSAVVAANPDRLLWGSDWPHVMVKSTMPNDADLADLLIDWLPDDAIRQRVLVRNPELLYQFDVIGS